MTAVAHCMSCRGWFDADDYTGHRCQKVTCIACDQTMPHNVYVQHECLRTLFQVEVSTQCGPVTPASANSSDAALSWHPSSGDSARVLAPRRLRAVPVNESDAS